MRKERKRSSGTIVAKRGLSPGFSLWQWNHHSQQGPLSWAQLMAVEPSQPTGTSLLGSAYGSGTVAANKDLSPGLSFRNGSGTITANRDLSPGLSFRNGSGTVTANRDLSPGLSFQNGSGTVTANRDLSPGLSFWNGSGTVTANRDLSPGLSFWQWNCHSQQQETSLLGSAFGMAVELSQPTGTTLVGSVYGSGTIAANRDLSPGLSFQNGTLKNRKIGPKIQSRSRSLLRDRAWCVSHSFKEPPLLLGVLHPNTKLRQAERLFENQLIGPESIAHIGDVMFTGTADGRVVKLENGEIETIARFGSGPCKTRDDEPVCGRPLGIRAGPNGTLFVADAYKGLFEVNPWKREVKLLLSSETPIEGKKMSFVNDLTVTQDGRKIYFTDSSSKWQRRDYLLLVMEGTDDGRLLEYDTVTREVKVLLDQLRFPNGVQLSPAEDFVLVAETTMARIRSSLVRRR
ncbi:adipocyte plasma membrane-associated protein isoform X2 [Papio anubis]|uniref:adipocyte plasma membrane-associated protein isoform X2 n=1 Tax=Papio anubis TaxID=9555 RepID=UPI0012AE72CE|nr:adipocyte plasma membrane-associated protein isoform X2 [Papio anubis]